MIARMNRMIAERDREKGFTLVELLVVIIIIGILAAIAIPAFLNQRTKAYDAAAKSDIKNATTALETFYTDGFRYPTTALEFTGSGFNGSDGVTTRVVYNNGTNAGYVVFAKHAQSDQWWVASSYNGGAPAKSTSLNALPTAAADIATLKLPTGMANTNGFSVTG